MLSDLHDPTALPALKLLAQRHDCVVLQLQRPGRARPARRRLLPRARGRDGPGVRHARPRSVARPGATSPSELQARRHRPPADRHRPAVRRTAAALLQGARPARARGAVMHGTIALPRLVLASLRSLLGRCAGRCAADGRSADADASACRRGSSSSCCRAPSWRSKPLDDRRAPVVLRIVDVYPHGTAFRYDLEYYGLEPGTFDLRDYLRRKDGSSTADLPPIRGRRSQPLLAAGPGPAATRWSRGRRRRWAAIALAAVIGGGALGGWACWRSCSSAGASGAAIAPASARAADAGRPAAAAGRARPWPGTLSRDAARRAGAAAARATGGAGCGSRTRSRPRRSPRCASTPRPGRCCGSWKTWLHRPGPARRRSTSPRCCGRTATCRRRDRPSRGRLAGTDRERLDACAMSFAYPLVLLAAGRARGAARLGLAARQAGALVLPFDHGRPGSGRGWRVAARPGRVAAGAAAGRRRSSSWPGRSGSSEPKTKRALTNIEFCVDVSGSMTAPVRRRQPLRRGDEGDRRVPRLPQGRRVRPDVLRQQRAALGAADDRRLGDPLRAAVHAAGERAALVRRHRDRQGAAGVPEGAGRARRRATA